MHNLCDMNGIDLLIIRKTQWIILKSYLDNNWELGKKIWTTIKNSKHKNDDVMVAQRCVIEIEFISVNIIALMKQGFIIMGAVKKKKKKSPLIYKRTLKFTPSINSLFHA